VAEVNIPAGWELTSATCSDGSPVTAIVLGAGETVTCTFTNVQQVNEGCTPGFWKNHPDAWGPTGFTTSMTLEDVFNVPDSLGLDSVTLLDALSFEGGMGNLGAAKILLRAAVAAILNAAHPDVDYDFTVAEIVADVNAALAGNRNDMLELAADLDAANNAGCPLGNEAVAVTAQVTIGLALVPLAGAIAGFARRRRGRA
jgi:hypothetical protein